MTEPTFDIVSVFIFPKGKKAVKVNIEHKIQICETIQMANLSLVGDPEVKLTNQEIQELVISERIYLN